MPQPINSLADWMSLPKFEFPFIRDESQKGKVHLIQKVGIAAIPIADCKAADLTPDLIEMGRAILPTCVVGDVLYQLPLSLAKWAFDAMGLAKMGVNPFPCNVEFGLLRDREYAEIL